MATDRPAFEIFRDQLVSLVGFDATDDAQLIQDLYAASTPYYAEGIDTQVIPTLIAGSSNAPASYQKYLGDFQKIRKLDIGVTSLGDFVATRNAYKQLMKDYGLTDLANNDTADKFMMNQVSYNEAAQRLNVAFNAVNNADAALKAQLQAYYPSLNPTDIAKTILGVGKTVDELKTQIGTAEIKAEQATAGVQSTLSAEELYKQGVTRAGARAGYQELAQSLQPTTAAAERAGISTEQLQTELEKENLLGLASQRRKKIQKAEQNLFSGQSGTANISLGQSSVGRF